MLLLSIPAAIYLGNYSAWAYLVVPGLGYLLNRQYLEWLANGPPGRFRLWCYELGLRGYSDAHATRHCLFIGDARVINPAASALIEERLLSRAGEEAGHGA